MARETRARESVSTAGAVGGRIADKISARRTGFQIRKLESELKSVQTQIRSCKTKLKKLEKRRDELQSELE